MSFDKISKSELEEVFKDGLDRSMFIDNYAHFGTDGNDDYYKNFIDTNISIAGKAYQLQEDAIELSLVMGLYSHAYLRIISNILHSRRSFQIKLLCLDWLEYFEAEIPKETYVELNLFTQNSKDELLKLQSILNLIQVNPDKELLEESLEILKKTSYPALFYRCLNCINDGPQSTIFPHSFLKDLYELIRIKEIFGEGQKADLELKLLAYLTSV